MRTILTLTFILSCFVGCSQKPLTLIIDTLDFVHKSAQDGFKITVTNQGIASLGQTDQNAKVTLTDYPNFYTTVTLESDSANIRIPIDQEQGYLELSNVFELDTIRINKVKLYSNCFKDSIKTRIEYYRVINDSVADQPYEVKYKETAEKGKCKRRPPIKTPLVINDQVYFVSIQKRKCEAGEVIHGHGHKPKMTERNYGNYSGTKFHFSSYIDRYINVITVDLNQ
ncbi:MAG: hypothetical protein MK081_08910 [Flavobacteriales bacterium]|nr:hypothetical protein [Flavobacteriales bacterium]